MSEYILDYEYGLFGVIWFITYIKLQIIQEYSI